jgi:hypothetical protein
MRRPPPDRRRPTPDRDPTAVTPADRVFYFCVGGVLGGLIGLFTGVGSLALVLALVFGMLGAGLGGFDWFTRIAHWFRWWR